MREWQEAIDELARRLARASSTAAPASATDILAAVRLAHRAVAQLWDGDSRDDAWFSYTGAVLHLNRAEAELRETLPRPARLAGSIELPELADTDATIVATGVIGLLGSVVTALVAGLEPGAPLDGSLGAARAVSQIDGARRELGALASA